MLRTASSRGPHRPKGSSVSSALITGGAGFIGSNLADAVVADGRACHVVDDLSNGQEIRVPSEAELHETRHPLGRRADGDRSRRAAPARSSTWPPRPTCARPCEDPGYDADVNIIGTINVLEAARAVGARVVFASTGGAGYGEYEGLPVPSPETAETRPLSHYGMSKMAGEGYCHLYGRLYGNETAVLRLGNVYGPRQDPHGEAGVVAIFCGRLLDGERPEVFGDGLQTRDYVYVGDVVRAFLAAEAGTPGETVNIGCGVEVTVLDLLEGLGYEGEPEFVPARAGELQRSVLDVSKAARLYGWRARDVAARRPVGHARVGHRRSYGAGRPPPRGLLARRELGRPHRAALQHRRRALVAPSSAAPAGRRPRPSAAACSPSSRSGGRQGPAECASEARKWAAPPASSSSAVRRAAGPWSPRNEPAVSCTSAPRPTRSRMRSGARWMASARSGWARITRVAADLQVAQDLGQLQRPALRRASPAAASARRRRGWPCPAPGRSWRPGRSREISPPVRISSGMSASVSASRRSPTPDRTRRASVG